MMAGGSYWARVRNAVDLVWSDSHRRIGLLLTTGAVGLLLLATAASAALMFQVADATDMVEHSYVVRAELGRLQGAVDAVEIAARDRVAARSAEPQAEFFAQRAKIEADVASLRKLVVDNFAQEDTLDQLAALTEARLRELGPFFRGDPVTLAADGALVEIRGLIDRFDSAERLLLVKRERTAGRLQTGLLALVVVCLISAAVASVALIRTHWSYLFDLRAQTQALREESESRKKAEGLLLQAQKLETIGQFTAGIAHDFNNILTIVLGNLETARMRLESEAGPAGRVVRAIDMATEGARRAATLTQRLLAFARLQPLAPRRLDLNRTVAGISEALSRLVGETIRIETVLGAGLWDAFADASEIESAIINLVVNSRDAMPDGGNITIETANAHFDEHYVARFGDILPGQYVMLSVSDTGSGIPREALPKVFDPFFTTKEVGKGTGLGLAMIHGLVKQSKGHIVIYSEVGQGTIVKIYLPRMADAAEAAAAPVYGPREGPTPRARPGEVVLMVEDDEGVRAFGASALESVGFRVLAAGEAGQALALLREGERVDLLFTDVVLPGAVNGRQLAEEARKLRPDLPVLFTTGYTRNAIVHDGRLDADARLLSKPYTLDFLARAVRRLIDDARAVR